MLSLFFIGLLGLASLSSFGLAAKAHKEHWGDNDLPSGGFIFSGGVVGLLFTFFFFSLTTITTVPAGHVGVKVVLGNVSPDYLTEGVHLWANPLSQIVNMSVRTHTYTMSAKTDEGPIKGGDSIEALSKNGMSMHMEVSVPHRLVPSSASWVYKNLGPDYDVQIVRPAIATAVREATANFTEDEAYSSKRAELVTMMKTRLESQIANILKHYGEGSPEQIIVFPEVQLRNVGLPATVQEAINLKIATEQKIVQARNEATRKEIEAGGIKKFQDIVSQGITPDLLKWKGIEATETIAASTNSKVIIIGNSTRDLPVLLNGDGDPIIVPNKK